MQAWSGAVGAFQLSSAFLNFLHIALMMQKPPSHFKNFNFKDNTVIQTFKTISLYLFNEFATSASSEKNLLLLGRAAF